MDIMHTTSKMKLSNVVDDDAPTSETMPPDRIATDVAHTDAANETPPMARVCATCGSRGATMERDRVWRCALCGDAM